VGDVQSDRSNVIIKLLRETIGKPGEPALTHAERKVLPFNVAGRNVLLQTFMKSAQYAGFIDATSGRFVKPGIAAHEEPPQEKPDVKKRTDGNEPPGLHPFVQGLLKELPKAGEVWPEAQRKLWLDTAASIFKMIYKDGEAERKPSMFPRRSDMKDSTE
jgi:hypothetical protein